MSKRSFRPDKRAEGDPGYPTSDACTDRRAFLRGLGGLLLATAAAGTVMAGCGSRAVGEPDPKKKPKPDNPYDDTTIGGVVDTMPAPLDGGPEPDPDGEPEPPVHDGGVAPDMGAPLDSLPSGD